MNNFLIVAGINLKFSVNSQLSFIDFVANWLLFCKQPSLFFLNTVFSLIKAHSLITRTKGHNTFFTLFWVNFCSFAPFSVYNFKIFTIFLKQIMFTRSARLLERTQYTDLNRVNLTLCIKIFKSIEQFFSLK